MAVTLEELEKRMIALEGEMTSLRQRLNHARADETPAERGGRLLREARTSRQLPSVLVTQAFAQLGITGSPVGAENVQKMVAACGLRPEDNEFSRGIIAMREE